MRLRSRKPGAKFSFRYGRGKYDPTTIRLDLEEFVVECGFGPNQALVDFLEDVIIQKISSEEILVNLLLGTSANTLLTMHEMPCILAGLKVLTENETKKHQIIARKIVDFMFHNNSDAGENNHQIPKFSTHVPPSPLEASATPPH